MKALTARERKIAIAAANLIVDEQSEDIKKRSQAFVYAAMLNAGIPASKINKVVEEEKSVERGYISKRYDKEADYALFQGLIDHGVNVEMTKTEM